MLARLSHEEGAKRDAQKTRVARGCGIRSPAVATIAAATTAAATATAAAATTATTATTAITTATTTAATSAGLALFRNADAKRTTFEVRSVELRDGFLGIGVAAHRDECKAARTARLTVNHELGFGDFTGLAERAQKHVFGGVEGKVTHVQSVVHYLLLSTVGLPCGSVTAGADSVDSGFGACAPGHTVAAGETTIRDLIDERAARRLPNMLCDGPCSADPVTAQPNAGS
jgi:hypothetical protein